MKKEVFTVKKKQKLGKKKIKSKLEVNKKRKEVYMIIIVKEQEEELKTILTEKIRKGYVLDESFKEIVESIIKTIK